MGNKTYYIVSGVFFSLVALAHLLRIIYGLPVNIDQYDVPMLFSWIALIVPGVLAFWAFRLACEAAA